MSLDLVLRSIFSAVFLASILRISTPLILPALGGLVTDLAGATNIALEGIMLTAAFAGVIVSAFTGNAWIGALAGVAAGIFISAILAYFYLYLKTDVFLAGIAINIMAAGGTTLFLYIVCGEKGNSSALVSGILPFIDIPILEDIPFLGTVLSGHNILTYVAFLLTWLVAVFLYRTRLGFHLRAAGENPEAAGTVGINVKQTQLIAFLMSGFLAALGGINLSMGYLTLFQREMTAGRGFIALAAVYLGGRNPWGTLAAAMIFGFADALANQLGSLAIPSEIVQSIPYAATIIALVVYALQKRARIVERARRFHEQEAKSTQAG